MAHGPGSHNMMAARADITPQVARLAWTQLRQAPRPLRVMYDGEVLRKFRRTKPKKKGGLELWARS
ncbi:MAG: hypothetical protein CM1200mP4_3930 [Rhodospirillaceae bacterium]|nr:MAG: hypothetical protein CM1200mP4_3930 [Rhodospirillaceae bacterium]